MRTLISCKYHEDSQTVELLYTDGTLNADFDYEVDFAADTGTVLMGGESSDPERCWQSSTPRWHG